MQIKMSRNKGLALLYLAPWAFFKLTGFLDVDTFIIQKFATSYLAAIALLVEYFCVAWSVWTLISSEIKKLLKEK